MAKKTKADPTGQRVNRRKTANALKRRLKSARSKIIANFKRITFVKETDDLKTNGSFFRYTYEPDFFRQLTNDIINTELGTLQRDTPFDWWFNREIELPWRQGYLEEINEINVLGSPSPEFIKLQSQQVLFSSEYINALRNVQAINYGYVKSLSERTAAQVFAEVNNGISAGLSPNEITRSITGRFNVSYTNAKRIADTEINRAYNDARLKAIETAKAVNPSVNFAVLHISSLLLTTRPHHASRHGNLYTPNQQLLWWDKGSNRINCHCTTRTVTLTDTGEVVQSELQKRIKQDKRNLK